MIVVKTREDLNLVNSEDLKRSINEQMNLLNEQGFEDSDIPESGQFVILEKGDNIKSQEFIESLGMFADMGDKGLLGYFVEWLDEETVDGQAWHVFYVLRDDSFGTIFYCPVGLFDDEFEEWLKQGF